MASTNKTAHLGLNQWVLSDPLMMEDVNEDNRKIDAAVGGKSEYVKLKEIKTSTGGVAQIDLDVSDIKFADWQYVYLDVYVSTRSFVRVNNQSYYSSYNSYGYTQTQSGAIAEVYSQCRIMFVPAKGAVSSISTLTIGGDNFCSGKSDLGYLNLSTINFVAKSSNDKFDAGDRFTFWGVK